MPNRRHRKPFKPSVRVICSLGTLAHNRAFKARELIEYNSGNPFSRAHDPMRNKTMAWLKKHGHVRKVDGGWYPTAKGWNMVEKACRLPRGRR